MHQDNEPPRQESPGSAPEPDGRGGADELRHDAEERAALVTRIAAEIATQDRELLDRLA